MHFGLWKWEKNSLQAPTLENQIDDGPFMRNALIYDDDFIQEEYGMVLRHYA